MIIQKIKPGLLFFLILFCSVVFSGTVSAAGSATVSWTPPTTDEGGGALTGLAGYKVFYNTSSTWLDVLTTCLVGGGTEIDVADGEASSYYFENNLTAGQTYYFAVAAYDDAETPNVSKCATTAGALTEANKLVSYTADLDDNHTVNLLDFNAFRSNWGNTDCDNVANFIGKSSNCTVNLLDFNVLRGDYGNSF